MFVNNLPFKKPGSFDNRRFLEQNPAGKVKKQTYVFASMKKTRLSFFLPHVQASFFILIPEMIRSPL